MDAERGYQPSNHSVSGSLDQQHSAGAGASNRQYIGSDRQTPRCSDRLNPVLVTRRPDGTLGGVSLAVANALAVHLGVPIQLKPYDNPARYNDSLRSRPMTGTLASLPAIPRALTISHSVRHLWRSTTVTLQVLTLHRLAQRRSTSPA